LKSQPNLCLYPFWPFTLSVSILNESLKNEKLIKQLKEMTYGRIIILIGVLIGILLFKKTKPNFLKGILIGLVVSYGLSFFENELLADISFFSFGLLSLTFTIYSGIKRKWLSLIIGLFAFVSFFGGLMYWPYANELRLLMLVPILCYLMTFRKWESYKTELSILTIFVASELSQFLIIIRLWVD